ncbi:baseplate multidomain protein megatron [Xanthomonas oryzae]|uniref:baseplate multidomain protein megatron n=1 Tax=Xanthomonas oryzae TaxID=347 RepID=UPI00065525B8|nr:glycoside hydrolase TIM-barrel-like domain-containing protein [Xanthomonas oryzae]AKO18954.1 hypothetical protein ACU11_05190 [Xanthomonas oryzae pv. oryzicola]PUE93388.1 hypothetical protein C7T79_13750 [Xanthomonas oryzae pv. oryzicola]
MGGSARQLAGGVVGAVVGYFVSGGNPAGIAWGFSIGAGLAASTITTHVNTPRLTDVTNQTSTVGGTIAQGSGSFPCSGNLIWTSELVEKQVKKKSGGKGGGGGTTTTSYQYFRSYAIGVCLGEIDAFLIIKRNGKVVYTADPGASLDDVAYSKEWASRVSLYVGSEAQMPDPTIEAVEGVGNVAAFRGLAYIVVKSDDLTDLLGAVPQYEFVVSRTIKRVDDPVLNGIRAVTLIPATGEFLYATTRHTARLGSQFNTPTPLNFLANNGKSDIANAMDLLDRTLPHCTTVALVVSWFGTDLRADQCEILPGWAKGDGWGHIYWSGGNANQWQVNGSRWNGDGGRVWMITGAGAHGQRPVYGSTPSDTSIIEAIAFLKSRGKRVIFYPFIMMDIPASNTKPNPYDPAARQPVNPWRGRITCFPAYGVAGSPDGTSAAGAQVDTFFTRDYGFNRFISHYIALCAQAGGVDVFLIGSELVGLTKVRDSRTNCPAVSHLRALAARCKSAMPGCRVGYAADWTEYKGQQYGRDLIFGMDALWADAAIDFIGIDNYLPIADVRQEQNGSLIYDVDYLKANIEGGEYFDWYYADRANNVKVDITDGAYGEPWVYRQKDIRSFWSNAHFNRIDGVRQPTPTAWVPTSKPIWFTEYGCPAINRGPNQPNVFFDASSSESSLPYFSTGARDDAAQYAYYRAMIEYWRDNGGQMLDAANMVAWTWDVRPFPNFPNERVWNGRQSAGYYWADHNNYPRGHWLQGRLGNASIAAQIQEIASQVGVDAQSLDLSSLASVQMSGYRLASETTAVKAIEPMQMAYLFDVADFDKRIHCVRRGQWPVATIAYEDLVEPHAEEDAPLNIERVEETTLLRKLSLTAFDPTLGYQTNTQFAERRVGTIQATSESSQELPMTMPPDDLASIALRRLKIAWGERERAQFRTTLKYAYLTPTDEVWVEDDTGAFHRLRLERVMEDAGVLSFEGTRAASFIYDAQADGVAAYPPSSTTPGLIGDTSLYVLDLPVLKDTQDVLGVHVALLGNGAGWNGAAIQISIDGGQSVYQTVTAPVDSSVGFTTVDLRAEQSSTYLSDQRLSITMNDPPESITQSAKLNYGNRLAIQTPEGAWEVVQFDQVQTHDDGSYGLSGLVRGRYSTTTGAIPAGAVCVLLNDYTYFLPMESWMAAATLHVRAVSNGLVADEVPWRGYTALRTSQTEWPPAMVTARRDASDTVTVSWIGRGRIGAEIAARNSQYFTGYKVTWSDGVTSTTTQTTLTRAAVPVGVTVRVCGTNLITGDGTDSTTVST